MTIIERSTVVGIFTDRLQANQAVDELHTIGITDGQIDYVVHDAPGTPDMIEPTAVGSRTVERATFSAAGGGVAGGIVGAVASLLIPAFSLLVAGNILLVTLGGLIVGAIAGGIVGVLISMALPVEPTLAQQGEAQAGLVIVTVNAPGREQEAGEVLHRFGAYDAVTRPAPSATAAPPNDSNP